MGVLTIFGTGFGAYIMGMAVLSPCPLLVHSTSGTVVIVRLFIFLHVLHRIKFQTSCSILHLIKA